ncbi:MAG: hypothetical protein IKP71_00460, partial [Candidatus Riflebacteria bacterium]|nr:hypothetical protein [Candidatus Riflebacteria bacterium]
NRNYYAKIYCYARLSYKSFTVSFSSFEVNFSPSGLAANLSTSNKNVNGTAFTFINGVNLTWNTSTSNAATLSKYNVYRSTTSGSGYEKVGEVAAGTTSYLDKPENPGTYYYVITDVDTNGVESPYSKEISITSPGQITGLTGEVITPWSPTSTFIRLGSNPSPGGAEIYFLRGTSSGNYNHYASWGGNTSVDDTNDLTDDTVYYYSAAYVFSYSPVRYSPLCEEISVYYLTPPLGLNAHYSYDFTNMQDRIVLSWNAKNVANLQSYSIYRSTSQNGTYSLIDTVNGSTTTFNDIHVEPGTTYYYKISCTTNKGSSGLSFPVSAYVSTPPTNLTANMQSPTRVDLNWTAPNPANTNHNGYYIYRGLIASGPYTQIGKVWNNTVTYTDQDGTPYGNNLRIDEGDCFFYVVADFDYSENIISGYSNVAKASRLFPPTNLTATENGANITLNWTTSTCPPEKLGGYKIYRGEYNDGPYELVGTVVGNTTTFNDTTAPYNANSYYVVTTYNINNGESDYSNEAECFHHAPVSITVTIDASVAPEIVLSESNVADIPVNWSIDSILPGVTITNYTVTIYKSNGSSIQSGSTSNSSAETYTVNNVLLTNGQSYYAEVTVTYVVNGETRVETYHSTNDFTAITPATLEVIDGWSGKDIEYSFFDNRVEACWEHDIDSSVVRYEIAVGTTQYGTDLVDWQDIGLTKRISLITPELASGTRYFTSV